MTNDEVEAIRRRDKSPYMAATAWLSQSEEDRRALLAAYDAIAARFAEAEISRDSWKREAEMNADFGDQLHTALAALKEHGVHVAEKWCWCSPEVTDYRHNREGRTTDSAPHRENDV